MSSVVDVLRWSAIERKMWESCLSIKLWMSKTVVTSPRRRALWKNLLQCNLYLGLWVLGRNDPALGVDCSRNWGRTTAFWADRPGADRLWCGSTVSWRLHSWKFHSWNFHFLELWFFETFHYLEHLLLRKKWHGTFALKMSGNCSSIDVRD